MADFVCVLDPQPLPADRCDEKGPPLKLCAVQPIEEKYDLSVAVSWCDSQMFYVLRNLNNNG